MITFRELKALVAQNKNKKFTIQLPNQKLVPAAFHITEVGQVSKTFIDCGGKVRSQVTALLQVWLGPDEDHRLNTRKLAKILDISSSVVLNEDSPVEVEYEDAVISQFPVEETVAAGDAVVLRLGTKHTDCLAKDSCLPDSCGDGGGCCAPPGKPGAIPIQKAANG